MFILNSLCNQDFFCFSVLLAYLYHLVSLLQSETEKPDDPTGKDLDLGFPEDDDVQPEGNPISHKTQVANALSKPVPIIGFV